MEILIYPHPKLREKAGKVHRFDAHLKKTVEEMIKLMREKNGVGLAAPQVGISKRIVVIELQPKENEQISPIPLTILINPKITKLSPEKEVAKEGCLSLPEKEVPVERAVKCTILAQDLEGNRIKLKPQGLFARICQHEIDHLEGVLIIDKASKLPADAGAWRNL